MNNLIDSCDFSAVSYDENAQYTTEELNSLNAQYALVFNKYVDGCRSNHNSAILKTVLDELTNEGSEWPKRWLTLPNNFTFEDIKIASHEESDGLLVHNLSPKHVAPPSISVQRCSPDVSGKNNSIQSKSCNDLDKLLAREREEPTLLVRSGLSVANYDTSSNNYALISSYATLSPEDIEKKNAMTIVRSFKHFHVHLNVIEQRLESLKIEPITAASSADIYRNRRMAMIAGGAGLVIAGLGLGVMYMTGMSIAATALGMVLIALAAASVLSCGYGFFCPSSEASKNASKTTYADDEEFDEEIVTSYWAQLVSV